MILELTPTMPFSIKIIRSIIEPDSLQTMIETCFPHLSLQKITLLSVGDNDNYLVQTLKENYVLRIYRHNKHWIPSKAHHLFEIDFLLFLKNATVNVSYPIAQVDGNHLGSLLTPEGIRYWTLLSYAPGQLMRFTKTNCYQYGQTIAQLHQALNHFVSPHPSLSIDSTFLLDLPLARIKHHLGNDNKKISELSKLTETLSRKIAHFHSQTYDNEWGAIGGDFHGGNHFCTRDGGITLFDFDLCGYGFRSYDIAVFKWALFNICKRAPRVNYKEELWQAFLAGYQSHLCLNSTQLSMIPVFVQARQIWLMGSETMYPDKILDQDYWRKMFIGLKEATLAIP